MAKASRTARVGGRRPGLTPPTGGKAARVLKSSRRFQDKGPPEAHALGGLEHSADTLANLNARISDATLDDVSGSRPPSGAAGGELGGTYPNPTVNNGSDATAIHDDTAGEINAVAEKLTPVAGDLLLIEDSAAANAKKRVQVGNLPGGGGGPPGTWTQLAKGPTTVADNTTVVLATLSGIADGEVVVAFVSARSDAVIQVFQDNAGSAGGDEATWEIRKTATADQHELRLRHNTGASRTFDWVAFKVLPA